MHDTAGVNQKRPGCFYINNLCILEYPATWQNSQPAREVKNNF